MTADCDGSTADPTGTSGGPDDATGRFAVVAAAQLLVLATLVGALSSLAIPPALVEYVPELSGRLAVRTQDLLAELYWLLLAVPALVLLVDWADGDERRDRLGRTLREAAASLGSLAVVAVAIYAVVDPGTRFVASVAVVALVLGLLPGLALWTLRRTVPAELRLAGVVLGSHVALATGLVLVDGLELPGTGVLHLLAGLADSVGLVVPGFVGALALLVATVGTLVRSERAESAGPSTPLAVAVLLGTPFAVLAVARAVAVQTQDAFVGPLVALAAVGLPVFALGTLAATRPDAGTTAHHALGVLLLTLALASPLLVGTVTWSDATETTALGTYPEMQFEVEHVREVPGEAGADGSPGYDLVRVTYRGPGPLRSDGLRFRGDGFVAGADADQTEPGPWQGETSGPRDLVVANDSVTLAVNRSHCSAYVALSDHYDVHVCGPAWDDANEHVAAGNYSHPRRPDS